VPCGVYFRAISGFRGLGVIRLVGKMGFMSVRSVGVLRKSAQKRRVKLSDSVGKAVFESIIFGIICVSVRQGRSLTRLASDGVGVGKSRGRRGRRSTINGGA
jgi:hypothetical protein